ncbi:Gfo/Idh/MocA family protein [Tropicibacter naphthalenivorans]|uniref:Glucose--fructose oxidoreductase n=1 Tax=Tropicibacter naphthalenivorans TaxID=441103 RepID=A0A0P1GSE8_9RHOB|nr:Gfo/Idh/MocA family oxidoreductase [Tropicibacter naphthalenivorans]CUH77518.1 Glucose--fructose oxidoreductase precursor [Tropicibacter naphthalenivorans]SMC56616.1 Predicted dehydrogenase [Tropicibacter naphthalenivorans]
MRLKLGMVGGGQGAFIGGVHRIAARIDGQWDLVAGALSSDPVRARASGAELGLDPARCYDDFAAMAQAEAARPDGIDAVAIVTPNHMHAAPAIAFLDAGIHVICDKPLAASMEDARAIAAAVARSGKQFILTHNYTGYPLMRQAREMIARGDLGTLRVVQVEYAQDWLAEETHNKQADWRTDPARSGAGGCVGDIGTHAYNLACFVTGREAQSLAADLDAFVPGRQVDDNVHVMLRFDGGAKGMLWASQVAVGNENALRLRVYGTKGGIEWAQENPNQMTFTRFGEAKQILTRGGAGATEAGLAGVRIPPGHPEGYLEGFATLYADAAARIRGAKAEALQGIDEGLSGMRFIKACIASSQNNGAWTELG